MATISRTSTPRGTRAGQTQTQVQTVAPTSTTTATRQAVLHLRGAARSGEEVEGEDGNTRTRRRIQWAEDVVDNEGLGRKKSKVCCIYHPPKGIDESSDESSSDSDDSDSGDDGSARPVRNEGHSHGHNHDEHNHSHEKGKGRARSPNAYEKTPKAKTGFPKS